MILSKVIEEIKQELDKRVSAFETCKDYYQLPEFNRGGIEALNGLKEFLDSNYLKEYKTGATRAFEVITVKYRGMDISIPREYFKGNGNMPDYTTTEVDDDMMWRLFREWCNIKNFESFKEISPEVEGTIWGWAARDKDGQLWFFQEKPEKLERAGIWHTDCECIAVPRDLFPKITWESEPREIKLLMVDEEDSYARGK